MPLATLAIAWVLANPNVSAAIVGASRHEQLEDAARAVDVKLDADILERIDAALGSAVEKDPAKVESFPIRVWGRSYVVLRAGQRLATASRSSLGWNGLMR